MARPDTAVLRCALFFLYLIGCLCQHDCTGVDCPLLDNCIEEALENGACCASCLQKGCTCEGYQHYDCILAGFENGKVPEGDSYFVDYGSTECSCPVGGGPISCQFISCPEIPPNCIEVLEPEDGCMQCERIGCVHDEKKYEAGQSFQIDPCWVCYCPKEGGDIMCSRVPCDSPKVYEHTEDDTSSRRDSNPYRFDQQRPMYQFSTPSRPPLSGYLPLFKLPLIDKEDSEDYDYSPTDITDTYPQFLVPPTQSSISYNKALSIFQGSGRLDGTSTLSRLNIQGKMELRERHGVHDHPTDREEVTESPFSVELGTGSPHLEPTISWQLSQGLTSIQSVSFSDLSPPTDLEKQVDAHRSLESVEFPLNQSLPCEFPLEYPDVNFNSAVQHQRDSEKVAHLQNASESVMPVSQMRSTEALPTREEDSERVEFPRYMLRNVETPVHSQSSTNDSKKLHGPDDRTLLNEDHIEEEKEEQKVNFQSFTGPEGKDVPYLSKSEQLERLHEDSEISNPTSSYEKIRSDPSSASTKMLEYQKSPLPNFITTTTQLPLRLILDEGLPMGNLPHITGREKVKSEEKKEEEEGSRLPVSHVKPEGDPVSAENLLQACCATGQRWARENFHCNHMPVLNNDKHSVCSLAQKQCCLSSVKESQCESGVTSARAGDTCEADEEHSCTEDSYQVCCSCCALGLWMRNEGQRCDTILHLSYPCSHIFLTCCEEEEGLGRFQLSRKEKPRSTALPRRVSDGKFPKEAFSISATDDAANAVEEQEDVDECQLYQGQLCQHTCTNIWGSYRCGCHQGYILQRDGHSCAPVSPNEENTVRENSPGGGPTQTPATTTTSSATTTISVHLDPCAENGACSQQCIAVGGQARCSCFPGFSLMIDGHTCEDVDECMTNTHSCQPSEHCVNTVGSFVCKLQVICPAGYQLKNSVCRDIDECTMRTDNCSEGYVCANTLGSFLCNPKHKCISGFTQDSHGNCIDINECSSPSEPCSPDSNCVNTVGSYTCQRKIIMCNRGYHPNPDGASCVDIDECQMGTHHCGGGQICHNLPGSYRCDCQTGYQYDALRKVCTDVNECWRSPGRVCAQTCENTPGSFYCSCTAGFSLAFDGKNCEDVNECDKNPCSQECANIYGSYQCYCRQGYFLKEDGHICEDIDECSQSIGNLCTFQCINVPGNYQCACPPDGYVMSVNGRTCRDVDECTTGTHNCSLGKTCYNLQGGFKCLLFDCPHNYKRVSDTRCERLSCPTNSLDCQNSPVRITYYQLSFQTNIIIPAQIFRIGPSPSYAGDNIVISLTKGNEDGYFSTRKLNSFTGAVYLQRKVSESKEFLIDVQMKLLRQGKITLFLARIYVFITSNRM
ncbi:fibulin-2 isoform X2 [Leuresthes tenuis]|uniref:fibulin-2 isoform X2 n=1 Tax=Leuresthes tenuis TaxID=355514 RepID=UPI003B5049C4